MHRLAHSVGHCAPDGFIPVTGICNRALIFFFITITYNFSGGMPVDDAARFPANGHYPWANSVN